MYEIFLMPKSKLSIFYLIDCLRIEYVIKFMIVNKSDFEKGLIWESK